jgi:hypothetical protein
MSQNLDAPVNKGRDYVSTFTSQIHPRILVAMRWDVCHLRTVVFRTCFYEDLIMAHLSSFIYLIFTEQNPLEKSLWIG